MIFTLLLCKEAHVTVFDIFVPDPFGSCRLENRREDHPGDHRGTYRIRHADHGACFTALFDILTYDNTRTCPVGK